MPPPSHSYPRPKSAPSWRTCSRRRPPKTVMRIRAQGSENSPRRRSGSDHFPLAPAPRDEPSPLSLGQETLWFLDQLEPGNTTYNCPAVVRVTGPLDPEITRRAFETIVHRHESLRSTFHARGEARVVDVLPTAPLLLEFTDLSDLPSDERETRAKRLSDLEGRKPFDLASGPMLRLAVLRLGPLDHVVLMTVHHIAYDGWSTGVLVHEFTTLYRGFRGRPVDRTAAAADPVPGLRLLATPLARRRPARQSARFLETATSRHPAATRAADRPSPAAGLDIPRSRSAAELPDAAGGWPTGVGPSRRRDVVHDAVGRVSDAAAPLRRPGQRLRRLADRQPQPRRRRRADRLRRQYARPPRRLERQPDLLRIAQSDPRNVPQPPTGTRTCRSSGSCRPSPRTATLATRRCSRCYSSSRTRRSTSRRCRASTARCSSTPTTALRNST